MTNLRLFPFLLVLVAGCDPGLPEDAAASAEVEDGVTPTLAKRYAMSVRSVVKTHDPRIGDTTLDTQLLGLATTTQNGSDVLIEVQPCRLTLPQVSGYQPTIADKVIRK